MKKILLSMFFILFTSYGFAADKKMHKIVIQVNSADKITQKMALNNAINLQNHYGADNIKIEIVAYGPGLSLMTKNSKEASRIEDFLMKDIAFSACSNTIKKVEKRKGKKVQLIDEIKVVPAGAARIMELQEQGYAYLRP